MPLIAQTVGKGRSSKAEKLSFAFSDQPAISSDVSLNSSVNSVMSAPTMNSLAGGDDQSLHAGIGFQSRDGRADFIDRRDVELPPMRPDVILIGRILFPDKIEAQLGGDR